MSKNDMPGTIKVEHKIPVPPLHGGRATYPWADLEVGDSFKIPKEKERGIHCCARSFGQRNGFNGYKITVRREGEGYRVWRVK